VRRAGSAAKAKGEKRQRQPRFAFMTKSEVDHLEDGYRWRKYGQKAVKNSSYPRYAYVYILVRTASESTSTTSPLFVDVV
jgi:hypothetical protein